MNLKTLHNININQLVEAFNQSFCDYIVPLKITKEQLENKIKSENIKLEFSVGAFENNKLIGFILHGFNIVEGNKIAYNAGTGVIPEKRGNKITLTLLEYIIPKLKEQNIVKIKLEVITQNKVAYDIYNKIGFEIIRELNCYKGKIHSEIESTFETRDLKNYDWKILKSFWDWEPTWQNAISSIENNKDIYSAIGIFDFEKLIGYLIYNPNNNRIQQFAVAKKYRKQGVGKQLFKYISQKNNPEFSTINVDCDSIETNGFLKKIGFEMHIKQYEMELTL